MSGFQEVEVGKVKNEPLHKHPQRLLLICHEAGPVVEAPYPEQDEDAGSVEPLRGSIDNVKGNERSGGLCLYRSERCDIWKL